ncbi:MAG: 4Fe-4S binding protein [Nitrospirae bacterium]|nr:4Fe-4S binding protein [Nitrospirota bacterium]
MEKIDRSYVRYIRYAVQLYVFLFLVFAGYKFYLFVEHFVANEPANSAGAIEAVLRSRPPSIEGFLPIGALMSLKLWVATGVFDRIHPAGLVIFIAALLMAVLLKKGFCGWICPVGALSDALYRIRLRIFSRRFAMNRWVDYPLRSIKYLLLSLFVYIIVIKMDPPAIFSFIEGDYYRVADVKMLYFFTMMTKTTMYSLALLFVLSVIYRNFWCRYLCPYGGLLGLLSMVSPLKIRRADEACIHCHRCTRSCPSLIPVEDLTIVRTPECTGCLTCVSQCPSKGALDISLSERKKLHPLGFALFVVLLFFGSVLTGIISDKWNSSVTYDDYRRVIPDAASLDHP